MIIDSYLAYLGVGLGIGLISAFIGYGLYSGDTIFRGFIDVKN